MELRIEGGAALAGEATVSADKSIAHRALILSALSSGRADIAAAGAGEDNQSTARVLTGLGVSIARREGGFVVEGVGVKGLRPPAAPLDCGNSGTTMRLLAGVLAGAGISAELLGDSSLMRRPMGRVCRPLRALGARIEGARAGERELPPLVTGAGAFAGGHVDLAVASAQLKSALLLAGVVSGKAVSVLEPAASRDHTERMLAALGVEVTCERVGVGGVCVGVGADAVLAARDWQVPGDFSSAAFLLAAGLLVPRSRVVVRDVGLNPTRVGMLEVLRSLGASFAVEGERVEVGEPLGAVVAEASELVAGSEGAPLFIEGALIPRLIDELVVLAAVAARARGVTVVRGAGELRVKESDRVRETVRLLLAFGVDAEEREDGFLIRGPAKLTPARLDVGADHRLALSAAVLALAAPGESVLSGFEVAAVSYPDFVATIERLGARVRVVA